MQEKILLNVLDALEELSYYESENVAELIALRYKDITYHFTERNLKLVTELLKSCN
jgi:hypothetical protein